MSDSTENLLEGLLPSGVAVVYSHSLPPEATLLPGELTAAEGMVEKRMREFTHGRHCARLALNQLGLEAVAIPKAEDRSPVWPAGITGSISHSGEMAAAVAAPTANLAGLGIDFESKEPLSADLVNMICREDELPADTSRAKLVFCCKEALYKCIYPLIEVYVDFQEMRLQLETGENKDMGSFTATACSENFDADIVKNLQGKFALSDDLIFAVAWIRQNN